MNIYLTFDYELYFGERTGTARNCIFHPTQLLKEVADKHNIKLVQFVDIGYIIKLEEYKTRDVLAELTSMIGISREIAEANNNHSGGAQYFLKNVDAKFWHKVMNDCIIIRKYLQHINRQFFASEEKGFQSWCADMWAVLWNLWLRDIETKNIPEMEFSWASDPIEKVERLGLFHNAGITQQNMGSYPAFYKGAYHTGKDPFKDTHMQVVLNDENAKKHGTHYYVTKLIELKQKYNLNY